jgi:His-Xaa-Ser system protein HxsD
MKNVELFPKEAKAIVNINPKVFPLEVVYAACYVLLDKAYFILDGDPEKEIKVIIRAKDSGIKKNELEKIALQLHDELINYATYAVQAARNQGVREAIIKRALATNLGGEDYCPECEEEETLKEKAKEIEMPEDDDLFIKDPEGIAQPWTPEKAKGLKKPDELEGQDVC